MDPHPDRTPAADLSALTDDELTVLLSATEGGKLDATAVLREMFSRGLTIPTGIHRIKPLVVPHGIRLVRSDDQ